MAKWLNYNFSKLNLGSTVLEPKTSSRHPNDAIYDQPNRVYIDTEWTDVLRSRYASIRLLLIDFLQCKIHFYRLRIVDAKLSDTGNYSCMPTTAEGDSVMVHVINGECS